MWPNHLACRQSDIASLQQQLKDAEEKWSAQLMQARQAALEESMHRSTQQQSAVDRAVENGQRLQQQLDVVSAALAVKESELEAAHRQLAAALDGAHRMESTHAKVPSLLFYTCHACWLKCACWLHYALDWTTVGRRIWLMITTNNTCCMS